MNLDTLAAYLKMIHDRLDEVPSYRYATVQTASPLTIRFDNVGTNFQGVPATLVSGLTQGDRVLVATIGHRPIILGRGSGIPDTGWKNLLLETGYETYHRTPQYRVKDGVLYLRGSIKATSGNLPTSGQHQLTKAMPELADMDIWNTDTAVCFGPTGGSLARVYLNPPGYLSFGASAAYGNGTMSYMSLTGASGVWTID